MIDKKKLLNIKDLLLTKDPIGSNKNELVVMNKSHELNTTFTTMIRCLSTIPIKAIYILNL